MPASTGKQVHIDVPLSNMAIAYRPEGFIADKIWPEIPVNKQHDLYYVFDSADAFRREDSLRAPGDEAKIITRRVSSDAYYAKNYALKDNVPIEDIDNADPGFLLTERQSRAEFLKDKLYLDWEYRVAKNVTSGSNVYSYSPVGSGWGTAECDPIADLLTGMQVVQDHTGVRPNRIAMGEYGWRNLVESTTVLNRFFGSAGGANSRIVTIEMMKQLLQLDEFLIGGAYYNSAEEGQAQSLSQIWNDNALVYYAPMQPRKDKPSFGYSFRWKRIMDMQAMIYPVPKRHAEQVELGMYQDEKITASGLAFLLTGVGSSQ